jgi:hypothetical protein
MRDPRGRVFVAGDRIQRELVDPLPVDDFLRQPLARELTRDGLLVDFEIHDDRHVSAPRIEWVSQPSEWCRAQLLDAALLTLKIAERSIASGFELKDASAWNILFDGSVPVFCDHLSFEKVTRREWRAFGQFARHFILPLVVARRCGLPIHAQFRMYRDGMTPQLARALCGWRLLFSRVAPLLLAAGAADTRGGKPAPTAVDATRGGVHANLLRFCRFALAARAEPGRRRDVAPGAARGWSDYLRERDHYAADSIAAKTGQVRAWIERDRPSWALDLGANTGEFTLLAARSGARVVAVDADHGCIEKLYSAARGQPALERLVYPVVAQLDDLCAGRGWAGRESAGLLSRLAGRCELVMMLGLIHHLMIAGAIPVVAIAELAAELTGRTLILETISARDPMFQKLAAYYGREDAERTCGEEAQLAAFARHFDTVDRVPLPGTERALLLLAKRNA